jgi:enoyl-CoA hydratase/carnithine racemase
VVSGVADGSVRNVTKIETGTDELLGEIEGRVAMLTLNRPHARNSLSDTLSPALRTTIAELSASDEIGCVLLTGAGTAFCAGGDVKGMGDVKGIGAGARKDKQPRTAEEVTEELWVRQLTLTGALYAMPQPTVAALPGPAAGAGLSIALACDLRIAAESAFVTTGFANIGLSGDYGSSFFLTHLVGAAKARELLFLSDRIPAQECARLGIVNRVVPDDRLYDEARALARRLADGPGVAYRYMKENVDRALREDLPECLAGEARNLVASAQTADHKEAVRAFIEKRKPLFQGR